MSTLTVPNFEERLEEITSEVEKNKLKRYYQAIKENHARGIAQAFLELYYQEADKEDRTGLRKDLKGVLLNKLVENGSFGSIVEQQKLLERAKELEGLPFKDRIIQGETSKIFGCGYLVNPAEPDLLEPYVTMFDGNNMRHTKLSQEVRDVINNLASVAGVDLSITLKLDLEPDKELHLEKPLYPLSVNDLAMALLQQEELQSGKYQFKVVIDSADKNKAKVKYGIQEAEE